MQLSRLTSFSRSVARLPPTTALGCCFITSVLLGCGAEGPEEPNSLDTAASTTAPSGFTATGTSGSTTGGTSNTTATSGAGPSATTSGSAVTSAGVDTASATSAGAPSSTTGGDAGAGGSASIGGTSNVVGDVGTVGNTGSTGNPASNTVGTTTASTGGGGTGSTGCGAVGFHVDGTSVYDVNCNEFVMRGINVPHAWFSSNTQVAFSDAASVGANAVRVVLATGGQWSRTSGATLSQIISWAKENQLVAMLEVHDSTGFGESAAAVHPDDAVAYWTSSDVLGAITGQEAYVMINIANEPFGNTESAQWSSFHQAAVQALRSAGLKHLLVVDAPNWGQDWEENMRNDNDSAASNIMNADPDRNVLFSVHMYDVYGSANTVTSYIDTFLGHGLPLIVGEFAADHGAGKDVDEATIMSKAESSRIGYIGWSWSGNSGDLGSLDITTNFNVTSLTPWGSTLVNGPAGIAETAQTCSCFQ
ncbi:MAG TPA: glycoside hydrolase family 5 protein [Polyangiaceae bacterium]|nr:glycoside hydrolase family 5 protein [Polyangiaceae bacterium]